MLAYGFEHNAQFHEKQCREEREEDEESGLHRLRAEARNSRVHGQQVLNGPRLTSHFCHNPAAWTSQVRFLTVLLILKESCQNVTIADHMESGVEGLVASSFIS